MSGKPAAGSDGGWRAGALHGGAYEQTLDSTWRSDQNTGTFIRLLWKDVNPARGVYDFTVLRREMEQAVRYGKLFSLGVKAGDDGTPDWIFSAGIPRLSFQDFDNPNPTSCGTRMDLGNPTRAAYQDLYFTMLREVAAFVKSRADWYRALAYVKISGANQISHENRLPNGCTSVNGVTCPCNPRVFAEDGYRPSGLYTFYDAQTRRLRELFPGKALNYALIQDGFPQINETGGYLNYNGNSSNSAPLPGAFEQTQTVMDRGRTNHGLFFTVAHNGVGPKVPGCNFDGQHPKPERPLDGYWAVGSGCPNRWAVREGARGQITGYQTQNRNGVATPAELDLALQNTWDNTDGVYLEIYEDIFWGAANANRGVLPRSGKTLAQWADELHRRRVDPAFPQFTAARNPFPSTYSFTFQRSDAGQRRHAAHLHARRGGRHAEPGVGGGELALPHGDGVQRGVRRAQRLDYDGIAGFDVFGALGFAGDVEDERVAVGQFENEPPLVDAFQRAFELRHGRGHGLPEGEGEPEAPGHGFFFSKTAFNCR